MNAHTPEPAVSPLALQNHALLQALYDGEHKTLTALAEGLGRDKSNVSKSLKSLAEADLVWKPEDAFWSLTVPGIDTLGRLGRLTGEPRSPEPAAPTSGDTVTLVWAQIFPDPMNPRRDFDSEEAIEGIEELAASIDDVGEVLQNLVVRPLPNAERTLDHYRIVDGAGNALPFYQLVAGERRWRAVGQLIKSGRRPETFPIPCKVRDLDDAKAKRWALIENLKRVDLKPMEEARAFKALVDDGMSTEAIAVEVLGHERKQRYVQQRIQLLELTEGQQAQVDGGGLTIKAALDILRRRPAAMELSTYEALVVLEIAWKNRDHYRWRDVTVDWALHVQAEDEASAVHAMRKRDLILFNYNYGDGSSQVRLGYDGGSNALSQLTQFGVLELAEALRQARESAIADKLPGLVPVKSLDDFGDDNSLLLNFNPPFSIDPVRAQKVADEKAEQARRDEERKDREARFARWRAGIMKLTADVEREQRKFTPPAPIDDRFASVLEQATAPLPWFFAAPETSGSRSSILAANGAVVLQGMNWGGAPAEDARLRMIVLATNAAAGLKTPTEPPAKPEPQAVDDADSDEDEDLDDDADGEFDEDEEG